MSKVMSSVYHALNCAEQFKPNKILPENEVRLEPIHFLQIVTIKFLLPFLKLSLLFGRKVMRVGVNKKNVSNKLA